jgi:hypothetical protein
LKILFTSFAKQPNLMRRSIVLGLPPQLVFPGLGDGAPLSVGDVVASLGHYETG